MQPLFCSLSTTAHYSFGKAIFPRTAIAVRRFLWRNFLNVIGRSAKTQHKSECVPAIRPTPNPTFTARHRNSWKLYHFRPTNEELSASSVIDGGNFCVALGSLAEGVGLPSRCSVISGASPPPIANLGLVHRTPAPKLPKARRGALGSLAEGVGFEPTKGVNPYSLSRGAPSATRPSLRSPARIAGGGRLLS
jgi:hypothetical protein